MVQEVEMKAWLSSAEAVRRSRSFLKSIAEGMQSVRKEDTYFARPGAQRSAFRLRQQGSLTLVNRKVHRLRGTMEENEELEFAIGDAGAFRKLAKKLGYAVFLRKTKASELYDLGSNCHAEITRVTGLGRFLEVEVLCQNPQEVAEARKRIRRMFTTLKLTAQIEKRQYSVMLRQKIS